MRFGEKLNNYEMIWRAGTVKPEVDITVFSSNQLILKGSCGYEIQDVIEAFQNINAHRVAAPEIVTHHFSHEQSVEAFKLASDPGSGSVKVVIDYN